jgi:hypothetical protein
MILKAGILKLHELSTQKYGGSGGIKSFCRKISFEVFIDNENDLQ